jgi:hypothetical protein
VELQGLTALQDGLTLLPQGLVAGVGTALGARLAAQHGVRYCALLALTILVVLCVVRLTTSEVYLDESFAHEQGSQLGTRVNAQAQVDLFKMVTRRARSDADARSHFPTRQAGGIQAGYLQLAGRQASGDAPRRAGDGDVEARAARQVARIHGRSAFHITAQAESP